MIQKFFILCFCFIVLLWNNSYSQSIKQLDSIITVLKSAPDDTNKVAIYDELYGFVNEYPNLIKDQLEPSIQLTQKLNNHYMETIFKTGSGKTYENLGEFDIALKYYLDAIRVAEKYNYFNYMPEIYTLIVQLYISINNFEKANEYLNKQFQVIQKISSSKEKALANYYFNKSRLYSKYENFDSVLYYTIEIANISKKYVNNSSEDKILYVNDLISVAIAYYFLKNYDKADQYFRQSEKILDEMGKNENLLKTYSSLYKNYANLYVETKEYEKALNFYNKSLQIAQKIGTHTTELENYKLIANLYSKQNNYKEEVNYLKKYYTIKDSLFSTDKQIKLNELESSYQIEKKNNILVQQEAINAKQKNERNIIIIIAVSILLALLSLFYFYSKIRSKSKLLSLQNNKISSQNEELEKLNAIKNRMFSVVSHDLRNPINALKSYFTIIKDDNLPAEVKEKYNNQFEHSVINTSSLMDNLLIWAQLQLNSKTPELKKMDLVDSIENVLAEVNYQAQLKSIIFKQNIAPININSHAIILEIVLRNIITNAIKFSNKDAIIELNSNINDQNIDIYIKDNGIGMNKEQIEQINLATLISKKGTQGEKGSGLGLMLAIQLLEQIKGKLSLISEENIGTTFTITLPLS